MDRGFYAYRNYLIGIRYGVVPLITPMKKFKNKEIFEIIKKVFLFNIASDPLCCYW